MMMQLPPDELFQQTFSDRVKGKPETCPFTTSGSAHADKQAMQIIQQSVRDVQLAGILAIHREALSMQNESINYDDVISFVESREIARNATSNNTALSAISSFKAIRHQKIYFD